MDDKLPLQFVCPHNGPGWAPAIHLSFATIIRELQMLYHLEASQVRKRHRSTHDEADEELRELKRRNVAMEAQIRERVADRDRDMGVADRDRKALDLDRRALDRDRRAVDRDMRVAKRNAAKGREQLAKLQ
ncbi:hypothetical protein B0T25DRAFT_562783 [Lasiosphaeria hispida]|uniref:Uncharacterized protein n=1 Tax=Lasiosphaeria hispida TaxID=260671 RepID=A0AAJ0HVS1_9PEZI|nr:hypothetical protein B0T25DRAFT_562783 [Lasiosphaeria hispida]